MKTRTASGDGLQVVVQTARHLHRLPGRTSSSISTQVIMAAAKSSSVTKAETYRGCFPRFSEELLENQLSFVLKSILAKG